MISMNSEHDAPEGARNGAANGKRNGVGDGEQNRAIVQRALAELVGTGDVEALGRYLSEDFVHHRPAPTSLGGAAGADAAANVTVDASKEEWLAAVAALPIDRLRVEVQHVLADGDHVAMYSRRRLADGGPGIASVDIWRLDDGLIVEGWEVIEPVANAAEHMLWWRPANDRQARH